MSDSVWPHRRQPTGLLYPWNSPGKNTGVGCHFLLQCMKVKSESEVAQSCLDSSWPCGLQPTPAYIMHILCIRHYSKFSIHINPSVLYILTMVFTSILINLEWFSLYHIIFCFMYIFTHSAGEWKMFSSPKKGFPPCYNEITYLNELQRTITNFASGFI